jgi:hypothetical protein
VAAAAAATKMTRQFPKPSNRRKRVQIKSSPSHRTSIVAMPNGNDEGTLDYYSIKFPYRRISTPNPRE